MAARAIAIDKMKERRRDVSNRPRAHFIYDAGTTNYIKIGLYDSSSPIVQLGVPLILYVCVVCRTGRLLPAKSTYCRESVSFSLSLLMLTLLIFSLSLLVLLLRVLVYVQHNRGRQQLQPSQVNMETRRQPHRPQFIELKQRLLLYVLLGLSYFSDYFLHGGYV